MLVLLKPEIHIFSKASATSWPLLFSRHPTAGSPRGRANFGSHPFLPSLPLHLLPQLLTSSHQAMRGCSPYGPFFRSSAPLETWSMGLWSFVFCHFVLPTTPPSDTDTEKVIRAGEKDGMALHFLSSFHPPFLLTFWTLVPSSISFVIFFPALL